MNPSVAVTPSSFGQRDPEPLERLRSAPVEVVENPHGRRLTEQEVFKLLDDRTLGIVAGVEPLTREVLEASSLEVISRCGTGLSSVDLDAAENLGIEVVRTPEAPVDAVAELTVGALVNLLRNVPAMDAALQDGHWEKSVGSEVGSRTIAIVGMGRIGRRVADLLEPFGPDVIGVDPQYDDPIDGVEITSLEDALDQADVFALHAAADERILGQEEIQRMKQGSVILNASRGRLVDEDAVLEGLDEGPLAGVWFDAFEEEPYEGPMAGRPGTLLTPHVGSYTRECRRNMELRAVENLLEALEERGCL